MHGASLGPSSDANELIKQQTKSHVASCARPIQFVNLPQRPWRRAYIYRLGGPRTCIICHDIRVIRKASNKRKSPRRHIRAPKGLYIRAKQITVVYLDAFFFVRATYALAQSLYTINNMRCILYKKKNASKHNIVSDYISHINKKNNNSETTNANHKLALLRWILLLSSATRRAWVLCVWLCAMLRARSFHAFGRFHLKVMVEPHLR